MLRRGRLGDATSPPALIERSDGVRWRRVPTPAPRGRALFGVACPSATQCVAVGTQRKTVGRMMTLIETWGGTSWSVTSSPDFPESDDTLFAVSCSSVGHCSAVGVLFDFHGYANAFAARLDGSTWEGSLAQPLVLSGPS